MRKIHVQLDLQLVRFNPSNGISQSYKKEWEQVKHKSHWLTTQAIPSATHPHTLKQTNWILST